MKECTFTLHDVFSAHFTITYLSIRKILLEKIFFLTELIKEFVNRHKRMTKHTGET